MVIPVRCLCNAYLQGPWNFRPTTREDQRAETQCKAARGSTASIATEGERHANRSASASHQFALSVSIEPDQVCGNLAGIRDGIIR